jgi:hypothetical protein
MKQVLIIIAFLFLYVDGRSQDNNLLPQAAPADTSGAQKPKTNSHTLVKKPVYHVTVGMDFSTSSGYGSGFTQYVVPTVSYPLGKKFMISGGLAIANTNYFNAKPWYAGEGFQPYSGNYTSITAFASGTYFVNDRLTISGSFYKEIPVSGKSLSYSPYNSFSGQGSQGFNINAQYRLGEHVFIQAGFGMSQGRDPYNSNPFSPYHTGMSPGMNVMGFPQSGYNLFGGY